MTTRTTQNMAEINDLLRRLGQVDADILLWIKSLIVERDTLRVALEALVEARDSEMGEDNSSQMLEWAAREYAAMEQAKRALQ